MQRTESPEEKLRYMTETHIPRLVSALAVPTIISMLISSIYNMADTYFVAKIGTSATGAVGVVFSLMAIIQAIGFTLGAGCGNYVSRLLGQQDRATASRVISTAFFSALAVGAVMAVLGLAFLTPLVRLLGATETILPYARDYTRYILLGAPYMMASLVLNNALRYQGCAVYAMVGITAGGILNIALDPLFIFTLGLGTGGAALATIISQFVSFCILVLNSGRGGSLRLRLSHVTLKWSIFSEILRGGMPSFYRQGLASVASICMNVSAGAFGDAAIAAMSIVNRVFQFANSALIGFGQGFQPVCGFNYGAKRFDRVLEAFWFCVKVGSVALVAMGLGGFFAARGILQLFRAEDAVVVSIGALALQLQCVTFPLATWITMVNMTLQTTGQGMRASVLSLARQGLFFLPFILVLPRLFGILGIQLSQPAADIFTFFALSLPMGARMLRELRQLRDTQPEYAPALSAGGDAP